MNNVINKESMCIEAKSIAIPFIIMTMSITWIFWWSIVIANTYGYLKHGTPLMMVFFILGGLSPAASAIILIIKNKRMSGKMLFKTICDFKQPIVMYIIVIVIAILSYIIPLIMKKATVTSPLYMVFLLIPANLVGGGLEEIGWRFIFQPALEKKMNFIFATIITAVIWSLWHLPLFFISGTNQSTWNFGIFSILALGMSFILAAIYKISKSVWICILYGTLLAKQ